DDSLTIRKVIESTLKNGGYEIHTAVDGEEGIQKAYELMPDIILIDFLMPKMNGYQVCKKLRKDQQFQHTPIILITAKGDDVGKTFSEKFTVDYFLKPFKPAQLLDKIKKVAANIKKTDFKPTPSITKPSQKIMEPAPPLSPKTVPKAEIKKPSIGLQPQKFVPPAITPPKPSEEPTINLDQLFKAGSDSIDVQKGQPIELAAESALQLEEFFLDKPAKPETIEQGLEELEFEEQPSFEAEELNLDEIGEAETVEQGLEELEFEEQPSFEAEELNLDEIGEAETVEQGLEELEFEEEAALEAEEFEPAAAEAAKEELSLGELGEVEAAEEELAFEEEGGLSEVEELSLGEPGEVEALEQRLEFEEEAALEAEEFEPAAVEAAKEELSLGEPGEFEALEQRLEFEEEAALEAEEFEPAAVEAAEQGLEFGEEAALEAEEFEPATVEAQMQEGKALDFLEEAGLEAQTISLQKEHEAEKPDVYALKDKIEQIIEEPGKTAIEPMEAAPAYFEEKQIKESLLTEQALIEKSEKHFVQDKQYEPQFAEEVLLKTYERINELLINFEKNLTDKMDILFTKTLSLSTASGASLSGGELLKFSVSDILNLLLQSNREGVLYIIASDQLTEISIRDGKIANFNTGKGRKLSTLFVDLKREFDLSEQQIAEAFENAIMKQNRLEKVLIDRGHITVDGIIAFYARQAKSVMNDLVNVKQGRFFFKDTCVEVDDFALKMSFDELMSYRSE
ncbi:MAG TPA: response regulator, partial [Thermodesulfovibrionia bacterium]|nr:response regulator [Thermodesulfovibrionia bacterium]